MVPLAPLATPLAPARGAKYLSLFYWKNVTIYKKYTFC